MADIFRPPLVQGAKKWPDIGTTFVNNLLATTLAVVVVIELPPGANSFPLQAQHPSHTLSINADTSKGVPETLLPVAPAPFVEQPTLPHHALL